MNYKINISLFLVFPGPGQKMSRKQADYDAINKIYK